MELDTFIIEDGPHMDLGETLEAFESYPALCQNLAEKKTAYFSFINELKSKKLSSITKKEERMADKLRDDLKGMEKSLLEAGEVLSRKLDDLIIEGKEREADLSGRLEDFVNKTDMENGQALLAAAMELRGSNRIFHAVQKACEAKESLESLVNRARGLWIENHHKTVQSYVARESL